MKVVILIPTKNRTSFVIKTILYYNSLKSKHPLYIGDASNETENKKIITFLKDIEHVEVRYFSWKNLDVEKTKLRLAEEASRSSEFSFCTYCGDDDYFVPESLTKMANFLSNNKDYKTAQGRAAMVEIDKAKSIGNIVGISDYWHKPSLENETALERFINFKKNYYVLQFSVHRIDDFIIASREFVKITENNDMSELLHCFLFAISGKSKFINCFQLIRVRHHNLFIKHLQTNIFEQICDKNWYKNYDQLINSLVYALIKNQTNLSESEAKEKVKIMLSEYIDSQFRKKLQINIKKNIYFNYKKIIKIILPKFIFSRLQIIIKTILKKDIDLLIYKKAKFYNDFIPIEKSLNGKLNKDN